MTVRILRLPNWAPMAAWSGGFADRIYVKDRYRNHTDLLDHERVHNAQATKDGEWTFRFRYVFSPRWRVRYEAEAYATSVRLGMPLAAAARSLASGLYLWPCTVDEAEAAIGSYL